MGFPREAAGRGLRRCEGPEGGRCWPQRRQTEVVVELWRKEGGAGLGVRQPAPGACGRAIPGLSWEVILLLGADTDPSRDSSPPFTPSSRRSYPEIKATVIGVERGGGLT